MANQNAKSGIIVKGNVKGHSVIPLETPLNRLHYYDGKYLRAQDLNREQTYMRSLVALSNQAGGMGVVHGFDCNVINPGDLLEVGGGMAVDSGGRLIFLPATIRVGIEELLEKSRQQVSEKPSRTAGEGLSFQECELKSGTGPGDIIQGDELYIVFAGSIEAYCGEEDIYGKLCEDACITGTERPYIIEGAVIRALPLVLRSPLKTSSSVTLTGAHLRSLVASAYFKDEKNGHLISAEGLEKGPWCRGSKLPYDTIDVPIALLVRNGKTTRFLDPWIPRRERMEAPARSWWAGQMAMRPWHIFLAQVLQFQCQLKDCVTKGGFVREDPCDDLRAVIRHTAVEVKDWIDYYAKVTQAFTQVGDMTVPEYKGGAATLATLDGKLKEALVPPLTDRALINCGIVEVPSAGYLPVVPSSVSTVNKQVRAKFGSGVDLRFCVVRPDYVPHALEEAQHMERICLLKGLDNPNDKPKVDVLVPGGTIKEIEVKPAGTGYEMTLSMNLLFGFSGWSDSPGGKRSFTSPGVHMEELSGAASIASLNTFMGGISSFFGAARSETLPTGGGAFYYAGIEQEDKMEFTRILPDYLLRTDFDNVIRREISITPSNLYGSGLSGSTSGKFATAAPAFGRYPWLEGDKERGSAATWLSMSMLQDVFDLNTNQSTPLSGTLMILLPIAQGRTGASIADFTFNGNLYVDAVLSGTGGNPRIKAHLSGILIMKRISAGESTPSQTIDIDENVILERSEGDSGFADILITLANTTLFNRAGVIVERKWVDGSSAEAAGYLVPYVAGKGEVADPSGLLALKDGQAVSRTEKELETLSSGLRISKKDKRIELFNAKQAIDKNALLPGSRAHDASTQAIRLIGSTMNAISLTGLTMNIRRLTASAVNAAGLAGATMNGTRFEVQATRSLFPPPEEVPAELQILATTDWVLFHRRRDKVCESVSVMPQVQSRRYRIYSIGVKNQVELTTLVDGLNDNNGSIIDSFAPQSISIVEFSPGIHTMATPSEYLLADWRMKVPAADQLAYGAVASRGDAFDEGETLAKARLGNLRDILKSANDVTDDALFEPLSMVPDVMGEGSVDGVMVFAALAVQPVCQGVYRIAYADSVVGELKEVLEGNNGEGVDIELRLKEQFDALWVHDAGFYPETWGVYDKSTDGLSEKWNENGGGAVEAVVVISEESQETPVPTESELLKETTLLKNRAGVISGALKGPTTHGEIEHFRTWAEIDKCSSIAILLARQQGDIVCHKVYMYKGITDDDLLVNLRNSLGAWTLSDKRFESIYEPVGQVRFELPATLVEQSEIDSVAVKFADFDDSLKRHVITLLPQESAGETPDPSPEPKPETADLVAQATVISNKLGNDDPPEELTFGRADLPGDCAGVTVVVLVRITGRVRVHMPLIMADSDFIMSADAEAGFNFDENNDLLFDGQYLNAVRVLKKKDIKIDALAFAGETTPEGEAAAKRLDALYTALAREGLVKEGGTKERLKLAEHDRKVLNQGSLRFDNVFVARF